MDFSAKGFINKDTCGGMIQKVQIISENVRIPESVLEKQSIITNCCRTTHSATSFDPSIPEAETGRFLSLSPAWSTERVPGKSVHRETLSQTTTKVQVTAVTQLHGPISKI